MSEPNELLKDARELAEKIAHAAFSFIYCAHDSATIRTLVDLVEAYARTEPELLATLERCENTIQNQPELVAACKTCDEVITEFRTHYPSRERQLWEKLNAAGHLARRAAKLPEPQGDTPLKWAATSGHQPQSDDPFEAVPAPPVDWDRWHELLDIKDARALTPREGTEYRRLARIAAQLDVEEGRAANASLEKLVAEHERVIASLRRLTAAVEAEAKAEPAPPIEVEMRVQHMPSNVVGYWVWNHQLAGTWFAEIGLVGEARYTSAQHAEIAGNEWLISLSDQLGVPLAAKWEDGE